MGNSKATSTPVKPGARARLYPGVSCVTFTPTGSSGQLEDINHFDVPDEGANEGDRRGFMIAWEVVKATKEGEHEMFRPIIEAAVSVLSAPSPGAYQPSKRCAAVGFLAAIEDILASACQNIELSPMFAERLRWYEQDAEAELKHLRKENAVFVASMTTKSKAVAHG